MTSAPSDPRGVLRLLNTAGGRVLCLAGDVGADVVQAFLGRYGCEPVRVDGIDARSAVSLSPPALDLVRAHLDAAARAGRTVTVRPSSRAELDPDPGAGGTGPDVVDPQ